MPQLSNTPLRIRPARCEELFDLRHRVLRQGLPRDSARFDGDELPQARHFVAIDDAGDIVGCASVIPSAWQGSPAWQVRGMAVDERCRGRGVGSALLNTIESAVTNTTGSSPQLWCNARSPAVAFYQRHGWVIASEEFIIEAAGPHFKMTRRLQV